MNKTVKRTLSLASAVLATPLYFGVRNFAKNKDKPFLSKCYFSLVTALTISASSFLVGAFGINRGITSYSQSRRPICVEKIDADYYSLTSTQRTFVTSMPLRELCFSFATPIAPIVQRALGEYPQHKTTTIVGTLEHDSIKYNLETTLNGHVPLNKIDAKKILESEPEIRVKESSMKDLLKECGL